MSPINSRLSSDETELYRRKISKLSRKLNTTMQENNTLQDELTALNRKVAQVISETKSFDDELEVQMSQLSRGFDDISFENEALINLMSDLSSSYFTFKNIAAATKNIADYAEEYNKKYSYYDELRRISLGYTVGLDSQIHSIDSMRKSVEKAYLKNSGYWLAYAIASTMLWYNNEQDAANRAIAKSLSIDFFNTSLYYLLVNLRFNRTSAAKKWYIHYLDRVDVNNLGEEWQYLLEAYLAGAFGRGSEFEDFIKQNFNDMIYKATNNSEEFTKKIIDKTLLWAKNFPNKKRYDYPCLSRVCKDYQKLEEMLLCAEKNEHIAAYFSDILLAHDNEKLSIQTKLENVLYNIISSYDKDELELLKKLKYNELIIETKGNEELASARFKTLFWSDSETKGFDGLLIYWVFSDKSLKVSLPVKRFAISLLKEDVSKGLALYMQEYRSSDCIFYNMEIDGCMLKCSEHDFISGQRTISNYYEKKQHTEIFLDKFLWVFFGLSALSFISIVISFFSLSNKVIFLEIIAFAAFGTLFLGRYIHMLNKIKEKKRQSINTLKQALNELSNIRTRYSHADMNFIRLKNVLKRF